MQDIPPVPVVDTPTCDNNNSSIQDIISPLSDTVSPQQTPVTLKLLNKSYSAMYSQLIAIKEFLLNKICILRKEVYTNKDRMQHLISPQDKKNNRVNYKGFLTRRRKPKVTEPNYRKPYNHWQNAEYFKYREGQSG